jgi:hypothetical protein
LGWDYSLLAQANEGTKYHPDFDGKMQMVNKYILKYVWIPGLAIAISLPAFFALAGSQTAASKQDSHKVIAYYFHTNARCSKCRKIEAYSKEAIEQGFQNELKSGALELRIVNYENPENRHFITDYKLVTKSLVLVDFVNGKQTKWTNLKLVWQLTERKDAFINYVRKEVRDYLPKS